MDGRDLSPNCYAAERLVYRSVERQAQVVMAEEGFSGLDINQWNDYEYSDHRLETRTSYVPFGSDSNEDMTHHLQHSTYQDVITDYQEDSTSDDTQSYVTLKNHRFFDYNEALASRKSSPRSSIILDGDFTQMPYAVFDNPPDSMDESQAVSGYGSPIQKDGFSHDPAIVHNPEQHSSQDHHPDNSMLLLLKSLIDDFGNKPTTTSQMVESSSLQNKAKATNGNNKTSKSYVALIATAILNSVDKKLLLKDIYKFFIKTAEKNAPSWKNSVRYSLSVNECFVKVGKPNGGKCNYWTIHPAFVDAFSRGHFPRQQAKRLAMEHATGYKNSDHNHSVPLAVDL